MPICWAISRPVAFWRLNRNLRISDSTSVSERRSFENSPGAIGRNSPSWHCGSRGDGAAMSACAVPGESGSEWSLVREPPAAGGVRGNKASAAASPCLPGPSTVPASTCKMAANCVSRLWRRRSLSGGVEVMAMGCAGTCSSFKSTSANRPTQGNSLERQRSINGGVLIRMPYARCATISRTSAGHSRHAASRLPAALPRQPSRPPA